MVEVTITSQWATVGSGLVEETLASRVSAYGNSDPATSSVLRAWFVFGLSRKAWRQIDLHGDSTQTYRSTYEEFNETPGAFTSGSPAVTENIGWRLYGNRGCAYY